MERLINTLKEMPVSNVLDKKIGNYLVKKITTRTFILYSAENGDYLGRFVGADRMSKVLISKGVEV